MPSWVRALVAELHRLHWWWFAIIGVGMVVGSLALAALIIVQWPPDHFLDGKRQPFLATRHPIIRAIGHAGKNAGGVLIVAVGIVLTLPGVPGSGLLLILIGLTLVDFPGKRRMERRLLLRPAILRFVNRVRARFRRPPLEIEG